MTRIAELARRTDRLLRDQHPDEAFVRMLRAALHEWSQAVWTAAEALGASEPHGDDLDRGLKLAQRSVFVCGAARSGTSLLRDLLDGHPELVVIPSESRFYTAMEPGLMHLRPDRHRAYLACWWLQRLADPPPRWLLGRSASPYVAFARDFAGWWQVPERHEEARIASWPLAAFALAYAQRLGDGSLPPDARMWVEKTPGNEQFLSRIWQDFPAAKVIQIVRRPEAVLASIKAMTPHRWNRPRTLAHILARMGPSYRVAAGGHDRFPEDRYCAVRYEDLTANPEGVMRRIAGFLEIEPLPSLLQPTVAGRIAANNSSFGKSRPDLRQALDSIDRAALALSVSRHAAKLGYPFGETSSADSHSIVGGCAVPRGQSA